MTSTQAAILIGLLTTFGTVTYVTGLLILFALRDIRRALRNGWVVGPYPQHAGQSARQQITPKDPTS